MRLNICCHKRKTSIQIPGLLKELNSNFKNIFDLGNKSNITLNIDKGEIKNDFRIFTIMDTDDCKAQEKKEYIDKTLFNNYELKKYLTSIYNENNLEEVLCEANITDKIYKKGQKIQNYRALFPVCNRPLDSSSIKEMEIFSNNLRKTGKTNMYLFIDYCISQAKKRQIST